MTELIIVHIYIYIYNISPGRIGYLNAMPHSHSVLVEYTDDWASCEEGHWYNAPVYVICYTPLI